MAVSGGKVALVTTLAALTCGASAGSCSAAGGVEDLVGYGSATDYEGSAAAPALSSSTAAMRAGGGCTDTDSNADDFTAVTPTPAELLVAGGDLQRRRHRRPTGASAASARRSTSTSSRCSRSRSSGPRSASARPFSGDTPAAVSERVTVVSNNAAGYSLTVHRTRRSPPPTCRSGSRAPRRQGGTLGAVAVGRGAACDPDRARGRPRRSARRRLGAPPAATPGRRARLHGAAAGGRPRPLLGDGHLHADRPVRLVARRAGRSGRLRLGGGGQAARRADRVPGAVSRWRVGAGDGLGHELGQRGGRRRRRTRRASRSTSAAGRGSSPAAAVAGDHVRRRLTLAPGATGR